MSNLRNKIVYTGSHRGINFEIQNFDLHSVKDAWTFYLYIRLDSLPEDVRERFWLKAQENPIIKSIVSYDYYSEPLITDLEWHHGVTWYSKETGFDNEKRCVKIGCDYQHLCDEGRFYSADMVAKDAILCIDSLYLAIPNILQRCQYCGTYVDVVSQRNYCTPCEEKLNAKQS